RARVASIKQSKDGECPPKGNVLEVLQLRVVTDQEIRRNLPASRHHGYVLSTTGRLGDGRRVNRCSERKLPQLLALGSTQSNQLAVLRTYEDEPAVSSQNTSRLDRGTRPPLPDSLSLGRVDRPHCSCLVLWRIGSKVST